MEFEIFLKKFEPELKKIAFRLNEIPEFIDENDLVQEMRIHLWLKWKNGEFGDKTSSYILQSCYFHIKNYLRKIKDNFTEINIEEILLQNCKSYFCYSLNLVEEKFDESLINRKFTQREKQVYILCKQGLTLREIGKILKISFVRVYKIKNNIKKKILEQGLTNL